MRDEMDMRMLDAHRHSLARELGAFFRDFAAAFAWLHARMYDAPWEKGVRKPGTCV